MFLGSLAEFHRQFLSSLNVSACQMLRQKNALHTGCASAGHLFEKESDFQQEIAAVFDGPLKLALRNSVRQFQECTSVQTTLAIISVFASTVKVFV